jgi:ketosteroid isomerase-like protein
LNEFASEDTRMTTRSTIEDYFKRIEARHGHEELFADDVVFTMVTSPGRTATGKPACIQATARFYANVERLNLRQLLVDGDRAAALVRYTIKPSNGAPRFESDVAEFFDVRNGRIRTFTICFDTAPYPR